MMDSWFNYLNSLEKRKKDAVLDILQLCESIIPDTERAMPYGVPGLKFRHKNIIAVAAHSGHLGVYPFSPDIVSSAANKFNISNMAKGTLRFSFDQLPNEELITYIVSLRQKEIEKL